MSMSNASISVFGIGLNALSALLDKAEAYAEAKRIDPTVLLNARLFPDMFAFARHVLAKESRDRHPRIEGHVGDRVVAGDEGSVNQPTVKNAEQAVHATHCPDDSPHRVLRW